MRHYGFIFVITVIIGSHAGEPLDPMQKALADRDSTVEKAKAVYDKAVEVANAKLLLDLKSAAKRTGVDKVAIYSEILKLAPDDAEATAALEKEGKQADPLKDVLVEAEKGKAVYKVWSDKSKLDLDDTGLMDVVTGGKYTKHPNMQNKIVQVTAILVIPENGEYKAGLSATTKAKVTLNGKVVDWSKPTIIPLPKGRYPLVAEFETFPKTFSLQFGKKSDVSIEPLSAPYMDTDLNALKEFKKSKKGEN